MLNYLPYCCYHTVLDKLHVSKLVLIFWLLSCCHLHLHLYLDLLLSANGWKNGVSVTSEVANPVRKVCVVPKGRACGELIGLDYSESRLTALCARPAPS